LIFNLFTGQPFWLIILCLLLAGGYAVALYFREKKNEFPGYLKFLLGIARFLAVFLISFLLLSPYFRSITKEKEKPLIIVAIDNSQSILMNRDSAAFKSSFPLAADKLSDQLSAIGDVRKYIFGNEINQVSQSETFTDNILFNEKETDISRLFSELKNRYTNLNVGAVILASDGIYNTGANPVYSATQLPYPVYTVALGDTSTRMDLILSKVNFNRMVFLNNKFPVEVVLRANDASGSKTKISISQGDNLLISQDVMVENNDFTSSYQFVLDAKKSGLQKFLVTVTSVEGELSTTNNRKEIFVEVLDARSKILLISGAPHPDISALNQAITANLNYEVDEILLSDFSGNIEKYSMVILHQLPSSDFPADALLRSIRDKQVPALFILGTQSDYARFNQWNPGLKITTSSKTAFEETVPWINPGFTSFSLTENTLAWLSDLPPLISPLGEYQVSNAARILLKQRIGSVESTRPMILFNETLEGRSGVITGEGIWKWRLYNFARTKDHLAFNELINKIVQYLSLKEQKKNFRVYHASSFRETERVVFDAEVYNESYELINDPEVEIVISNDDERQFPYIFNKSGNAYHLDAGIFPPGNYTWKAEARAGAITYTSSGQFSVTSIDIEALNTVADHQLLHQLSEGSGGKMYFPSNLDDLAQDILSRDDIRPVTYTRKNYKDLLSTGWLLALILGLLTLEWFFRKRAGGY